MDEGWMKDGRGMGEGWKRNGRRLDEKCKKGWMKGWIKDG